MTMLNFILFLILWVCSFASYLSIWLLFPYFPDISLVPIVEFCCRFPASNVTFFKFFKKVNYCSREIVKSMRKKKYCLPIITASFTCLNIPEKLTFLFSSYFSWIWTAMKSYDIKDTWWYKCKWILFGWIELGTRHFYHLPLFAPLSASIQRQ